MTTYKSVECHIELLAGFEPGLANNFVWNISATRKPELPKFALARYDVNVLNNMAQATRSGTALTDKQAALALVIIEKYKRQFNKAGIDVDAILASPRYRMPIRSVDRTKRVWLDDSVLKIKFPYDVKMVQEARDFAKNPIGKVEFVPQEKTWHLGLTEPNVVWAYLWGQSNNLEIDPTVASMYEQISELEASDYAIELTQTEDGQLMVTNAETSLLEYIETRLGGLSFDNLTKLVDYAGILGYTVSPDLLAQVNPDVGRIGLIQDIRLDPTLPELDTVLRYVKASRRTPAVIFAPTKPYDDIEFTNKLRDHFVSDEIAFLGVDGRTKNGKSLDCVIDENSVKVIYTKKLPSTPINRTIPLFVTYQSLLYGSVKQSWLGQSERVIYMTDAKLN